MKQRSAKIVVATVASLMFLASAAEPATAADPIRVGIVQSGSGAFAPEETGLTDMLRMLIAEQNAKGGLLGRPIEAVVMDPKSDTAAYAEVARQLTSEQGVAVLFGGGHQDTCDTMGLVAEEFKTVLFCPGENTAIRANSWAIQLGSRAQQRIIPAVEFLRETAGIQSWVLASTDAVYGKEVNGLVEAYLKSKGVSSADLVTRYEGFGSTDWTDLAMETSKLQAKNKATAVVSTVLGESNNSFYEAFDKLGPDINDTPILTLGFDDASYLDQRGPLPGSLSVRSYFESLDTPENRDLVRRWRAFTGSSDRPITEMMAAEALGFSIWVSAVERAGSPDASAWLSDVPKIAVPGFAGTDVRVDASNQIVQSVLLGRAQENGSYVVEAKTPVLTGDLWNVEAAGTKDLVSKWSNVGICVEFDIGVGCKPGTIDRDKRTVNLLLATTRKVEQTANAGLHFASERGDLTFGTARVSVPAGHAFGQIDRRSWVQWLTLKPISDTEFQIQDEKSLSREEFTSAIKNTNPTDALVYVHGFRNTFEDSVFRLAQLVWDTKYQGVPVVFSWPSRGTTAGYGTDYDSAEYSAPSFRELLRTLKQDAHVGTVHVIAHSMGSRVVLQGLLRSDPPLGDKPIGELVFAAPDVDRQIFTQDIASVRNMAKGITLYANKNDWALFASKQLRSQFARAGDAGTPDGPLVAAGVDTIDISSVGKDFFSLNHSTFSESMLAMEEIASLLSGGVRPPDRRTHILIGMPQTSAPTYWKFPD
ncbi:alpha/beta fold hydrolase [Rhizobium leguminosarum]|uniref:alpha/beta fold hydrolase n=1 Tax=Rhizobium leguminosarum TaxID=384 RepID=UPI001F447FC2|nr:alpha/beta fold hydrolase [Rhizobium leguminosarum]UIJ81825.1 alpha/beta fold hydrolase [Rhizobium leguminosarum]